MNVPARAVAARGRQKLMALGASHGAPRSTAAASKIRKPVPSTTPV